MATPAPLPSAPPTSTTRTIASSPSPSTETKADIRSSSALRSLRQNFAYMLNPSSPTAPRPIHFRTRALLRTLRFLGVFIFWRLVRWAKYAAVGAAVAAIGATALGGFASGVGFLVAPPTMVGSLGLGVVWAMGKWGFRKAGFGSKVEEGEAGRKEVRRGEIREDGTWRDQQGPRAVPW